MRAKFVGLFVTLVFYSYGQEVEVKGGFVQDSLKIGLNVEYWLTAKYPSDIDLILPDSNFNFSPYEFGGRRFFETRSDSSRAIDSVIYSLQSFEIDPIQYLQLPATLILEDDSAKIFTSIDSIYLVELVPTATDTTALQTNTAYQKVGRQFNSPLLTIILGSLIVIGLIVLIVFGKKIRRYFILKRMAMAHENFLNNLSDKIEKLKINGTPDSAESALTIWKKYQEKIEKQPFTKLTSKEMIQYDFAKELEAPLRAIDRCVYGKISSESVYQDFQHLEGFSQNRYDHHIDIIKHGE
ncbi:MAG: hypothetical protein GY816_22000 [Cytophagales bacterium]|nr:hypothetical protein [Cytophagales bacterium]